MTLATMIILYLFTYSLSAEGWKNYKDPDVPQLPNLCTIKGQQIYELIKILFFVEKVQFLNLYGKIISTKILFIVIPIFPYQRTGSNLKRNYFKDGWEDEKEI